MDRFLNKIPLVNKIVIDAFALALLVSGAVVFAVARSAKLEDYCVKYSQEKLGDRWYENIGPCITREEYIAQTGQDTFLTSIIPRQVWVGLIFKCENRQP